MAYIYSTLMNGQSFTIDGFPVTEPVIIRGRNSRDANAIVTPKGMMTKVSDAQLTGLNKHPGFLGFVNAKYIAVENESVDVSRAVKANKLDKDDKSGQMSKKDLEDKGNKVHEL